MRGRERESEGKLGLWERTGCLFRLLSPPLVHVLLGMGGRGRRVRGGCVSIHQIFLSSSPLNDIVYAKDCVPQTLSIYRKHHPYTPNTVYHKQHTPNTTNNIHQTPPDPQPPLLPPFPRKQNKTQDPCKITQVAQPTYTSVR